MSVTIGKKSNPIDYKLKKFCVEKYLSSFRSKLAKETL